jgi:hypothetical protein
MNLWPTASLCLRERRRPLLLALREAAKAADAPTGRTHGPTYIDQGCSAELYIRRAGGRTSSLPRG